MIKLKSILDNFERIYGEKKFNKIYNDISNSKRSKKLIQQSINEKITLLGEDFITSVISNLRYSFTKGETLLVASLLLFELWIDAFGVAHGYPSKRVLIQIENEIIQKAKSMSFKSDFEILDIDESSISSTNNFEETDCPYFEKTLISTKSKPIAIEDGKEDLSAEYSESWQYRFYIDEFIFVQEMTPNMEDDFIKHCLKNDLGKIEKRQYINKWSFLGYENQNYIFHDEEDQHWYLNRNNLKVKKESYGSGVLYLIDNILSEKNLI